MEARSAVVVVVVALTLLQVISVIPAQRSAAVNNMPCVNCGRDDAMIVDAGNAERRSQLCGKGDIASSGFFDPTVSGHRVLCSPPPTVPDLFSAFSDVLRLHAAVMHNLTRRLLKSEPMCNVAANASISALRAGTESDDCVGTPAGVPCRRAAATVLQVPTVDRATPSVPVELVNLGGEPYYGSLEDIGYDSWEPAVVVDQSRQPPHPDSRRQPPPAAAYQSTVSTSSRPSGQLASPFLALWTTLHGKLLIIAVSISLVAAVIVLAVWISLRAKLSEPKYGEARATEEAVLMYGRVLRQADEQRRTRIASAPVAPPLGDDVTLPPDGNTGNQHHNHRTSHQRHQAVVIGHEIFSDERMTISSQPVRRYL